MKLKSITVCVGLVALLSTSASAGKVPPPQRGKCPRDSVLVGQICVDKYEASIWSMPPVVPRGNPVLKKIQKGTVKLVHLQEDGWTQISPSFLCEPPFPSTFPFDGQWTEPLYAVSIPGVHPAACVTWFQAAQACRLSGKRLLTNAEWQAAAVGTPDTGTDDGITDCNISSTDVANTGSRSSCKSTWGAFDMVGNVSEWVADWLPASAGGCPGWGNFSNDYMCLSGASTTQTSPGALVRGGDFGLVANPGVLAVKDFYPNGVGYTMGFRCAR
jgi:formylglycine-generating enzyme required for sulfatase activity